MTESNSIRMVAKHCNIDIILKTIIKNNIIIIHDKILMQIRNGRQGCHGDPALAAEEKETFSLLQ